MTGCVAIILRRILAVLLVGSVVQVQSDGQIELRLIRYRNPDRRALDSTCCRSNVYSVKHQSACRAPCNARVRVCLKQFQSKVDPSRPCAYGSRILDIFTSDDVEFSRLPAYAAPLLFPFDFRWPGDFSLIVEVSHYEAPGSDEFAKQNKNTASSQLLLRLAEPRHIRMSPKWTRETSVMTQNGASIEFEYRMVCQENYFGPNCAKYCRARNSTTTGQHYHCDVNGNKKCYPGWTGPNCQEPLCAFGCVHGTCHNAPGTCQCELGWTGQKCDQCQAYPGCKHGSCDQPWECKCDEGWGGSLCNLELNYCTKNRPCQNDATCVNTVGSYQCECRPGYTGTNCEVHIHNCQLQPCENNGVCVTTSNINDDQTADYQCHCLAGFYGKHCQIRAHTCADQPCQHGATCMDSSNGPSFVCHCARGWSGVVCDQQVDACAGSPCKNGGNCVRSYDGGYECKCQPGFEGQHCEHNINDCSQFACLNGGTCVDQLNKFKCRCAPGWSGSLCQTDVDDCVAQPCANGGTCFDRVNGFSCVCALGFRGHDCSIQTNECQSNPCVNGGHCERFADDYKCRCPACFHGKNCEQQNDDCQWWNRDSSVFGGQNGYDIAPTVQVLHTDTDVTSEQQQLHNTFLVVSLPIIAFFTLIVIVLCVVVLWLYKRAHGFTNTQDQIDTVAQNHHNERLAHSMLNNELRQKNDKRAEPNQYSDYRKSISIAADDQTKIDNHTYAAIKVVDNEHVYAELPDTRPPRQPPNTFNRLHHNDSSNKYNAHVKHQQLHVVMPGSSQATQNASGGTSISNSTDRLSASINIDDSDHDHASTSSSPITELSSIGSPVSPTTTTTNSDEPGGVSRRIEPVFCVAGSRRPIQGNVVRALELLQTDTASDQDNGRQSVDRTGHNGQPLAHRHVNDDLQQTDGGSDLV